MNLVQNIFSEKSKIEHIMYSLFFTYALIFVYITENIIGVVLGLLFMLLISTKNPMVSILTWINLLPYDFVLREFNSDVLYKHLFIVIVLSALYNLFKNYYYQDNKRLFQFLAFNIILLTLSHLMNMKNTSIISIFTNIYLFTFLICFVYIMFENKDSLAILLFSLSINSIILTVFHLIIAGEQRLSSFKNVRVLSNFYGLISILMVAILLGDKEFIKLKPLKENKSKAFFVLFILLFNLASITLSHSRGVVVAVLLTALVGVVGKVLSRNTSRTDKIKIIVGLIVFVGGVYLFSKTPWFKLINGDVLIHRLKKKSSENVRWQFWRYAIAELTPLQLIFGAGPDSFLNIVSSKFDYYSHSIYMDYLVSIGLLGLVSLFSFLSYILYNAYKSNKLSSMFLILFMSISFFSHGSMYSKYYWVYLGLVYVITFKDNYRILDEFTMNESLYPINKLITWTKFKLNVFFNKSLAILNKDYVLSLNTGIKIYNKFVDDMEPYVVDYVEGINPNELYIGFDALKDQYTLTEIQLKESPHYMLMSKLYDGESIDNSNYILRSSFGYLDERSYHYYSSKRLKSMEEIFAKRLDEISKGPSTIYIYEIGNNKYIVDGKHRAALSILLDKKVDCKVVSQEYIVESFRKKLYVKMKENKLEYKKNIEFFEKMGIDNYE